MNDHKLLQNERLNELLTILENRFTKNMYLHQELEWSKIRTKVESNPSKAWTINEMEVSGGEPNVIGQGKKSDVYIFADCCAESPKERRSFCYDPEALASRKVNKPKYSAVGFANEIGIDLLTEEEYRHLQTLGTFDLKTSSWLKTPEKIRTLGGAIFGDRRFDTVFTYHNGAESYYGGRSFRGKVLV